MSGGGIAADSGGQSLPDHRQRRVRADARCQRLPQHGRLRRLVPEDLHRGRGTQGHRLFLPLEHRRLSRRRPGSRRRRHHAAAGPHRCRRHGAASGGRRRQGRQHLRRQPRLDGPLQPDQQQHLAAADRSARHPLSDEHRHRRRLVHAGVLQRRGVLLPERRLTTVFPHQRPRLGSTPSSKSTATFPYPGCSPIVSANGSSNGIVWAHLHTTPAAVLYAYDASDLGRMLYNSNQAGGRDQLGAAVNKFVTPEHRRRQGIRPQTNGVAVFGLL